MLASKAGLRQEMYRVELGRRDLDIGHTCVYASWGGGMFEELHLRFLKLMQFVKQKLFLFLFNFLKSGDCGEIFLKAKCVSSV